MLTQISHRFVFDPGSDDVTPVWVLFQEATDGPVVGFWAARGKDDLAGVAGA